MLRFATTAGLALAAANIRSRMRALAIRLVLFALAGLFFVGAAAFGLVAAYVALVPVLGPIGAAGAVGGFLLLVALVLFLFARRAPREEIRRIDASASAGMQDQYAELGRLLSSGGILTNPVVLAAATALAAGYLVGRRRGR
ncbi:hypothetical protein [Propylenella binzhouense]|uniref:Holin-X, holin superfamily III n=1 Tax=Propylenella binzhouense TaxID=2555902 RepID=A0A964T5X6_9HYPH|nr:hypothetical protein [Propylenella binzhouense]MYZ49063.1 hypothetical protein [Propylenella binzhouense]